MSYSDDDDAPPPLSTLADQVQALKVVDQPSSSDRPTGAQLRVAAVTTSSGRSLEEEEKPKTALKKGFFDSKPKAKPKLAAAPASQAQPPDGVTMLRGRKDGMGTASKGPTIPDFLRVEPDEQERKLKAVRQELVAALKPTPDMVEQVAKDPALLAGFDDPEVMAAVSDIASNPSNFKKYQNNPKVIQFYKAMGMLAGQKLEKLGDKKLGAAQ